jgi:hypothetical protein
MKGMKKKPAICFAYDCNYVAYCKFNLKFLTLCVCILLFLEKET